MKTRAQRNRRMLACAALMAAGAALAAPVTIQPADGKDAQLANGDLSGSNFGSRPELITNWINDNRSIGLVEFDLGAYAGQSVSSATLGLFHTQNIARRSTYSVFRVTSAWDESTVTFDTAPTIDAVAVASLRIGALDSDTQVFRNWDVTSVVNGWLGGSFANFGLWIEEIPVQGSATAYFASSDAPSGQGPRLQFDTQQGVPEPGSLLLVGAALLAAASTRRGRPG